MYDIYFVGVILNFQPSSSHFLYRFPLSPSYFTLFLFYVKPSSFCNLVRDEWESVGIEERQRKESRSVSVAVWGKKELQFNPSGFDLLTWKKKRDKLKLKRDKDIKEDISISEAGGSDFQAVFLQRMDFEIGESANE